MEASAGRQLENKKNGLFRTDCKASSGVHFFVDMP